MSTLTADLGAFLAKVKYEDLPEEARALVRDAFTDTVGVTLAGVSEPIVDMVRRTLLHPSLAPNVRACLSPVTVPSSEAALIGGTAAHALDYDDQSLTGHPSAVLVPAILAEGEALDSTGRDMATAYVAGYEVWAEFIRRDGSYHLRGWHPTSVFGVVGAAAAAAVLRRLPAERAATALAIAASHAGGLGANFGTMTKPYHAGIAARDAVIAARLAASGATAGIDALENPKGFLTAYSLDMRPDRGSPVMVGKDWYLLRQRLCVKKYPTCYFMHRSFDATVRLLADRDISVEDIAEIEVRMGRGQTTVLTNTNPRTGLEAKFSEQFAMAAAVVLRRMGLAEVTDSVVRRPDIQAFFPKVKLTPLDEHDPRDPAHSPTEQVVIRLVSGEIIDSGPIARIEGHAYDPMSTAELWQKFEECTELTHSKDSAQILFDKLQHLDKLTSTREIPTADRVFAG